MHEKEFFIFWMNEEMSFDTKTRGSSPALVEPRFPSYDLVPLSSVKKKIRFHACLEEG